MEICRVFLEANECLKQGGPSKVRITICMDLVRRLAITQHMSFAEESSIHDRIGQARFEKAVAVIALPECIVQHGH